jgi:hypothetical protein
MLMPKNNSKEILKRSKSGRNVTAVVSTEGANQKIAVLGIF